MSTLTHGQIAAIGDFLEGRYLPPGIGDKKAACSMASINLALTGTLTDRIPECMSLVIGRWIIRVQDAMPDEIRNGEWKWLLPMAAGTGRDPEDEKRRLELITEWMWGTVLPYLQPVADARGFGDEWRAMCEQRTYNAATAANAAAAAAAAYATAANAAANAAAYAANAANGANAAAANAANAAGAAANAANAYAVNAAWAHFNPTAILDKLIG